MEPLKSTDLQCMYQINLSRAIDPDINIATHCSGRSRTLTVVVYGDRSVFCDSPELTLGATAPAPALHCGTLALSLAKMAVVTQSLA